MSTETITKTLLQEVMFELYDVSNGDRKMSKGFAKELAYNLTLSVDTYDKLNRIATEETKNSLTSVSIADLMRFSINAFIDSYKEIDK